MKFRTLIPDLHLNEQIPEAPHWRDLLRINGDRTSGLVFTPTELVAYFRPDALTLQREWPFVDFRFPPEPILWVPPLPPGGAYVERVASLTSTMPLAWIVNSIVASCLAITAWRMASAREQRTKGSVATALTRSQWIVAVGALASAAAMTVLTVTTVGITNRYLGDFFAISAVGAALGHHTIIPFLQGRPLRIATTGLAALLLIGWSVLATLSLTTRMVFL